MQNHQTSSSPKECLLLGPGRWGSLDGCEVFVETKINFVSRWILPNRAAFASSSCSNLDCSLTWPSSSFTHHINQMNWIKLFFKFSFFQDMWLHKLLEVEIIAYNFSPSLYSYKLLMRKIKYNYMFKNRKWNNFMQTIFT